jgi:hypothetical protein
MYYSFCIADYINTNYYIFPKIQATLLPLPPVQVVVPYYNGVGKQV